MKLRKTKKGFTIVELVIVIAVIGVLTAILVPTFINLTAKANQASDSSLVANLNTALKMQEAEDGEKNKTMHDAVLDLEKQGYKLSQLVTKSGQELVWDKDENQFALETDQVGARYWKIVKNLPSTNEKKLSFYAGHEWTATSASVVSGFDAGFQEGIASISYANSGDAQDVVIRTNGAGSALTINAPKDTVHHYNSLDSLTVTAIAGASYHEHGKISGKAVISQGHLEVEKGAQVSQVLVSGATGEVKVTANEQTTVVVDGTSAPKTSVVANADKVNVAGAAEGKISGDKAASVVAAVKVMNEAELATALNEDKPFIQLGASFDITSQKVFYSDTKFDLNGHALTIQDSVNYAFFVLAKTELYDSVGTGYISGSSFAPIVVYDSKSTFVMNGGEIKSSAVYGVWCQGNSKAIFNAGKITDCQYGIFNKASNVEINNITITGSTWGIVPVGNGNPGTAKLVINGGDISASGMAVSGNGNANSAGTIIEINGGKLSSDEVAIYHPQNGVLTIKGNPEIKGQTALYIKSGTTRIEGGKFITTLSSKVAYNYNGNGANATGDGIVIDACAYPGGNPSVEVTIDNASFELADRTAKNVAYYSHNSETAIVIVNGQVLEPIIG